MPEANHAKDPKLSKKIIAFVQSKVAPHKRLRGGVVLVEVIPKSCVPTLSPAVLGTLRTLTDARYFYRPSGKILRKDLRAAAAKEDEKASAKL